MCIGYQFAKIGTELGEGDNKINIGLLSMFKIGPITNNVSIHYRMRGKTEKSVGDYINWKEQPGNEIHYKFEPSKKIANNKQLSVFTMGYYGHNRQIDGEIIPNSRSYEIAFGSSYTNFLKTEKILVLSFLADIHVRSLADIHRRDMAFVFLFNVIW